MGFARSLLVCSAATSERAFERADRSFSGSHPLDRSCGAQYVFPTRQSVHETFFSW